MFGSAPIGGGLDHGLGWLDRFFDRAAFEALPITEQDRLQDAFNAEQGNGIPPGAGQRRRAATKLYIAAARRAGYYAAADAFTESEIAAHFA